MASFDELWDETPSPTIVPKKKRRANTASFDELWDDTSSDYPTSNFAEYSQLAEEVRPVDYSVLTNALSEATQPVVRAKEIISEEWDAGQGMMAEAAKGLEEGRMPLGAFWWLAGALRSGFAPLTGGARGLITEPVGENAQNLIETFSGLSEEERQAVRQFAAEHNLPLPGNFLGEVAGAGAEIAGLGTYARIIKAGMPHGEKLGGTLGRLAGEEKPIVGGYPEGEMGPPDIRSRFAETTTKVDGTGRPSVAATHIEDAPGLVNRLSVKLFGDIARNPELVQRVEAARRSGKVDERLYNTIGNELFDAMNRGDLNSGNLLKILEDLDVDPVEVFRQTASEGGRNLNTLSQIAKQLAKQKNTPAPLRKELDEIAKDLELRYGTGKNTVPAKIWNGITKGLNVWRASMVSQAVTAMRNAIGQTGRLGMGIVDDAIQAGMRGTSGRESMRNILDSIKADGKALRDQLPFIRDQKLLNDILDGNPITENQLLNKSVHEIDILNRYAKWINSLNIGQERFFRRLAFQARLDKSLKQHKLPDINGIDPKKIPAELLDDAVQHALDISFASSGGQIARSVTKAFENLPLLYTVNPFPRFAFGNALPFLIEHSPLGLAKALGPTAMRELAKGNTRTFLRAASRGLIGTTMLGAAMQMRDNPNAGERYYEWYTGPPDPETGERPYIDLRAFAPFTTYLFMAEALKGKDSTLNAMDYANATIGINRISGTGLVLVDALRAKKGETISDLTQKFVGQWGGVFTYPLKQAVDAEYAIRGGPARDTSGDTWQERVINPTLANIPIAEKTLPTRKDYIRGEIDRYVPFVPPARTKNVVEAELDRLGIARYTQGPRGGTKESVRFRSGVMSEYTSPIITAIITSDVPVKDLSSIKGMNNLKLPKMLEGELSYSELGDEGKKLVLKSALSLIRKSAKEEMINFGKVNARFQKDVVVPSARRDFQNKEYLNEWLEKQGYNVRL
jgi:hypothetical protein